MEGKEQQEESKNEAPEAKIDPCKTDALSGTSLLERVAAVAVAGEERQVTVPSSSPSPCSHMPTTVQGRVARARALKIEGNERFRNQEWKKAIEKYHHAKMFCKGIMDKLDLIPGLELAAGRLKATEEQQKEAADVMVAVTNNLAGDLQAHPSHNELIGDELNQSTHLG